MNRSVFRFLIIATVLLLAPYAAIAQDNHSNGSYTCAICHSTHNTLGSLGLNNICLTCHAPGTVSSKGGRIPPFSFGDMADPYGTLPGTKLHSSHKWTGQDEVPAAGALPPTDVNMTDSTKYPYLLGSISCARCHKINGSYNSGTNSAPYLRTLNDKDQMCLDCHRPRNTRSHLTGSHPVNFNYTSSTSKVKTRPGEYYPLPINSNPNNPTAAMQLKNGALLCTTCHGVHHTDSNSSTFDNNSSAVFGRLSSSKGYLLRTDLHGNSPSAINICTNCHKPYDKTANPNGKINNHNGKKTNQNIQCADCHGGHVDYAGANPPGNEVQPNVYLINRYMNVSSATGSYKTVRNAKVLYQYTSASAKNYNKNAFGVCVACHSTLPNTVSQHTSTDASVCASCHTHKAGFSADCTACHGMPPRLNAAGPDGYADGYQNVPGYVNESLSPHQSHALGSGNYYAFGCVECHNGNNHNSSPNTFQDVFKDKTGIKAGLAANYDPVARRCSNVYCHSNGAASALLVYTSVTWGNNKDSFIGKPGECGKCHSATPATNAHSKHIAGGTTNKSYVCVTCHSATVSDNTTLLSAARQSGGTHVNGLRDVLFSGTIGNATLSGSSCNTVYCHTDGKGGAPITSPNWQDANTGKCGSCHAYPMANFGHPAHLTASYGPGFGTVAPSACNQCHVYTDEGATTHVNGTLDNVVNACTTCHPSGAVWSGGRVTCDSCHTGTVRSRIYNIDAPDKSLASTQGHGKPNSSTGTTMAIACTTCHDQNSQHINSNPAVHTNRLAASLTGSLNTECTFCHNDAVKVPTARFRNMSTHFKVKGGSQAMECWQCHELHGTSNVSMVRAKIAYINTTSWNISFKNTSSAMIDTVSNRGLCQVCHTQTKYYRAGIAETGHPTKNCFSCHPHNAKGGAFSPSGGTCDTCHGYPPVPKSLAKGTWDGSASTRLTTFGTFGNYTNAKYENYSGGGGAHLSHVPNTAKASEGWTNCSGCHNDGLSHKMALPRSGDWRSSTDGIIGNVTVKVSPVQRFNNTYFPIYTGARLVNKPQTNQTGNCISVGCHFQPTPRWSLDR